MDLDHKNRDRIENNCSVKGMLTHTTLMVDNVVFIAKQCTCIQQQRTIEGKMYIPTNNGIGTHKT